MKTTQTTDINTSTLLRELAKVVPCLAISVQWQQDDLFRWDGEGPDPKREGYKPHNVNVRVSIIGMGRLIHGFDNLGGCYAKPGRLTESDHDVHGYLPQMVLAAVEEAETNLERMVGMTSPGLLLADTAAHLTTVRKGLEAGIQYLKGVMARRYDAQMNDGKGGK